ncbi:Gfo/Idh/MocA family oxidoreductase [Pseudomonas sp. ABC1]|uniref:Gfo/Idh/MocA family protein n=1 Tax=Pseudomonas sp. ABC1 TaxID=2748080 RepID=UPI0015C3172A|nr:Gfo/Idh/MocA family oxidoreductase [Pseudomonas sp. ABC1]QLF94159.1 Gfo/Idh/MocA family oxidoreductase [Pseudomonas sp. ABC1]
MASHPYPPIKHLEKTFQVAFLGGSYRSAIGRTHRIAIEMDHRFKLVAGCFSRSAERNSESADAYGIDTSRLYPSLAQMLESEKGRIDAVLILTPTDQHKDDVLACFAAGLPVICEKSLATSTADANAIRLAQEKHNGFLAVTYNYSGYPMVRELRQKIASGELGRILQIQCEMPQESFISLDAAGAPKTPQAWRLHDGKIPTVSLDLGTHLHSLVYFLTAQHPLRVVAQSSSLGNFSQVIDTVSCLIRYSADIDCTFWYSKAALGQRNGLKVRVFGEKGSAEWLQETPEMLITADNRGNRCILDRASGNIEEANEDRYTRFKAGHPAGFIEAFANYYQDVADALGDHIKQQGQPNPYVFGIDEASEGLLLFEAVQTSAQEQRWVDLP